MQSINLRPQIKNTVIIGLFLSVMIYSFGSAVWIYAKAWAAQQLITSAWQDTLSSQQPHPPWSWADTWPVARLQAPDHDQDLMVLASASGESLAFGPGHLVESALPGNPGTSVIAGHRDTHFAFLQKLKPGDLLRIQDKKGNWQRYRVDSTQIVNQKTQPLNITDQHQALVLVTCYPFNSVNPGGDLRYLVTAFAEQEPNKENTLGYELPHIKEDSTIQKHFTGYEHSFIYNSFGQQFVF